MRPITIWLRQFRQEDGKFSDWTFNHIEDGHSDRELPYACDPAQVNGWAKSNWKREHGHLDADNKVVRP